MDSLSDPTMSHYSIRIHISGNGSISPLEYLGDFSVDKRQLPDQGITFFHFENSHERKNGVNAMLRSATSTAALDF